MRGVLLLSLAALAVASPAATNQTYYPNRDLVATEVDGRMYYSYRAAPRLVQITSPHESWMSDIMADISNKTLKELTMPGTHDSGAYALTTDIVPGATSDFLTKLIEFAEKIHIPINDVITPWALAQDKNFYDQAVGGMRYFDVRAGWDNKNQEWRTFHFEFGNPIKTLLGDLNRFLSSHPNEVLIVEVSHFDGSPTVAQKEQLMQVIQQEIGQWLYPREASVAGFTVGDMIAKNKRVVCTVEYDVTNFPNLWPSNTIFNTYANSDKLDDMIAFDNTKAAYYNSHLTELANTLYKISWTLTPAADCIEKSILPGEPHTLIELANTANKVVHQYLDPLLAKGQRIGNIFIMDHFENTGVTVDVINALKEVNTQA